MKEYRPREYAKNVLDCAFAAINSVDYKVSLRWVFYRLVQEHGYSKTTKSYNTLKSYLSRARKRFYGPWRPWTLTNESRSIILPTGFGETEQSWINNVRNKKCVLDKQREQKENVIVVFEARAMIQQFAKYTAPYCVPLVPFAGARAPFPIRLDTSEPS